MAFKTIQRIHNTWADKIFLEVEKIKEFKQRVEQGVDEKKNVDCIWVVCETSRNNVNSRMYYLYKEVPKAML